MARKPSVILGISLGHGDSSAALIVDGQLVAAAEEERFTRLKHYALFPSRAIAYCLSHTRTEPGKVDVVAIARRPRSGFWHKVSMVVRHPGLLQNRRQRRTAEPAFNQPLSKLLKAAGLRRARTHFVEHHLAHMMSARYLAGPDDNIALMSFDGLGDFVSAAIGRPKGRDVEVLDRAWFPHSLGFFYTAMTQYLGFPHFGDEFKVMGLSSYGQPKFLPALRELIRESEPFGYKLNLEAFPILKRPIDFYIENGQPKMRPFYQSNFLTHVIGIPPRKRHEQLSDVHQDLAMSVQARFEEVANHLLKQLHAKVPTDTVCIAGGCAHNSVWAGKIPRNSPFKNVFIAPASSDAGIAVGAAIHAAGVPVSPEGGHWGLLGPDLPEVAGTSRALSPDVRENTFVDDESLIAWMVSELADGRIFGLFRGRMEFGPRALGCRSILADPRPEGMRDRLNERVKHRETFRPFAASVLREYQEKFFEDSFFCPSMEGVFKVKESMKGKIPSVVHADGTCRIQSVEKETQPFYWKLIEAFRRQTGVPMLINTSFNDSEPIVCTEEDALHCFMQSDLDHLVMGTRAYSKSRKVLALNPDIALIA